MKKIFIALVIVMMLGSFHVARAQVDTQTQSYDELKQELISLIQQLIAQLQSQLDDIIAKQKAQEALQSEDRNTLTVIQQKQDEISSTTQSIQAQVQSLTPQTGTVAEPTVTEQVCEKRRYKDDLSWHQVETIIGQNDPQETDTYWLYDCSLRTRPL